MKHLLALRELSPDQIASLVDRAIAMKTGRAGELTSTLRGRVLTMIFFNPSLRTRTSFEAGMLRLGGHSITLNAGGDTWKIECRDGAVMNADAAEHVREAAPVISRYCDILGVRTFAGLKDATADAADGMLRSFARFATRPVISLESAIEHPCQGLADRMTMTETLGDLRGRRFALTWAPHIKPLPLAVSHSALLAAASAGMSVTICHPPGYDLHPSIVDTAGHWCRAAGAKLDVSHDQSSCREADFVYVKSWGHPGWYADPSRQTADFAARLGWMVSADHLGTSTRLLHCLPTRRNVELADSALDDPRSSVVDQAENRMWAQMAVLEELLRG